MSSQLVSTFSSPETCVVMWVLLFFSTAESSDMFVIEPLRHWGCGIGFSNLRAQDCYLLFLFLTGAGCKNYSNVKTTALQKTCSPYSDYSGNFGRIMVR